MQIIFLRIGNNLNYSVFQRVDAIRCLRLFQERNNRGVFLTSSVGLGKSYVACQVAKYFIQNNGRVLLVAPSGLIDDNNQWPRYLREFNLYHKIDLARMGKLQGDPDTFESIELPNYDKSYSLIIVDEAHNYRNDDAYRTRNLKRIIDKNGDAKILFLTATPINTSLNNLLTLIRLYHRPHQNPNFDLVVRSLAEVIDLISETPYNELTREDKEKLRDVQGALELDTFVKSTRWTIKTSKEYLEEIRLFTGVDISSVPDPEVRELIYKLSSEYREVVNGIVDFIGGLKAAHLRIIEPEKGARLGSFFKWVLYKRFESDITSYYLTLARLLRKNRMILRAVKEKKIELLEDDGDEEDGESEFEALTSVTFNREYKERLSQVIVKIRKGNGKEYLSVLNELEEDTKKIKQELSKLLPLLVENSKMLFRNDHKLKVLKELIDDNKDRKILVFTEYKDTLRAIQSYLVDYYEGRTIQFVESKTENRTNIIERFNDPQDELRILISTDTLSEGYNLRGADIVVNFDIPYNPVRLIQRIGRATRLDLPKRVSVYNFRPHHEVDKEIDLIGRLELRIEDIIRFVGLEYRIWFEREAALLDERRKFDLEIYEQAAKQILEGIRQDLWKGRFDKLDVNIPYSNPVVSMMQKAIIKYGIKKEDVVGKKIDANSFTTLKGKRGLSIFYPPSRSYNTDPLRNILLDESTSQIILEKEFEQELADFKKHTPRRESKTCDAVFVQ